MLALGFVRCSPPASRPPTASRQPADRQGGPALAGTTLDGGHVRHRRPARPLGGGQLLRHLVRALHPGAPRAGGLRRGAPRGRRRHAGQRAVRRRPEHGPRVLRRQRRRVAGGARRRRRASPPTAASPRCPRPTSWPPTGRWSAKLIGGVTPTGSTASSPSPGRPPPGRARERAGPRRLPHGRAGSTPARCWSAGWRWRSCWSGLFVGVTDTGGERARGRGPATSPRRWRARRATASRWPTPTPARRGAIRTCIAERVGRGRRRRRDPRRAGRHVRRGDPAHARPVGLRRPGVDPAGGGPGAGLRRPGAGVPALAGPRRRPGERRRPRPGRRPRPPPDPPSAGRGGARGRHPRRRRRSARRARGRARRLAALEEQRDFLLRSLDDLEREHDAGDVDDNDYLALEDDYTARAARVIRAIEAREASRRGRPRHGAAGRRRRAVAGGVAGGRRSPCRRGRGLRRRWPGCWWPRPPGAAVTATRPPATSARPPAASSTTRPAWPPTATTTSAIDVYDDGAGRRPDQRRGARPTRAGPSSGRGDAARRGHAHRRRRGRPDYPDAHAFLAVAFQRLGRPETALASSTASTPSTPRPRSPPWSTACGKTSRPRLRRGVHHHDRRALTPARPGGAAALRPGAGRGRWTERPLVGAPTTQVRAPWATAVVVDAGRRRSRQVPQQVGDDVAVAADGDGGAPASRSSSASASDVAAPAPSVRRRSQLDRQAEALGERLERLVAPAARARQHPLDAGVGQQVGDGRRPARRPFFDSGRSSSWPSHAARSPAWAWRTRKSFTTVRLAPGTGSTGRVSAGRRSARTAGSAASRRSTSASVVDQPTDTRRLRWASTPMASSTGDGSSDSDEQALPECAATPARSSPSSTAWGSTPSTPRHTMCGEPVGRGRRGP